MIEPIFVSGSPMWTAVPPAGFTLQTPPAQFQPAFPQSAVAGITGAAPNSALGLSAPSIMSPNPYGYAAGGVPFTPQVVSLVGQIGDGTGGVPAASLLAAIALRRGQPQGPTTDQESEEFLYDAIEWLPGAADVEIRCEAGRAMLTGSVQHKRVKRDIGELAWAIPGLNDVQNNLTIASRRRTRPAGSREAEASSSGSARKQG
jgi:BON domain-containing protein